MKLCISVSPKEMNEALSLMSLHAGAADMIEVRTDGISDLDLARLLRRPRPTLIITNRREDEGGLFRGSAAEQSSLLAEALGLGAEYVDAELAWGGDFLRRLKSARRRGQVIVSVHDMRRTPADLDGLYDRARRTGAYAIKIAVTARDITDNKRLFLLLDRARTDRQRLAAVAMGERGIMSRVLAKKHGSFIAYIATGPQAATAEGQLTLSEVKNLYPVAAIDRRTKVFGLVGNPVAHSRGIYYHNGIFRKMSANAVYMNLLADDLRMFLAAYRDELAGFSVTIPFKQAIVPLLDSLDEGAGRIGAVNTVLNRRGKLTGYNTDFPAIRSLLRKKRTLQGASVLVMGSGGTARTMAHAAKSLGADVMIAGRSAEKVQELASDLSCPWSELSGLIRLRPDVLMNGTSVGLDPSSDEELIPEGFFRRSMLVFDAVYSPVGTRLMRTAASAGCDTISGEELFRAQAARQSKLFFGMIR